MATTETPATLSALIDERREADRATSVHIEIAARGADMTFVEAIAQQIAERIAGGDGSVVEDGTVGDGDVWLGHQWGCRGDPSVPDGVQSRARYHGGVVLVTPENVIPAAAVKALDARVRVVDDEIEAAYAVQHEPYEDRTYLHEIADGLEVADWWACPSCGTETVMVEDAPPHRACTACDWSVTIPEVVDGDS